MKSEQKSFLDKVVRGEWSINPDTGLVDVDGSVYINGRNLTKIPVNFGKVSGCFNCDHNKLKSLKGAPKSVGGSFYCCDNELTSLEGAPITVSRSFYCHINQLTSLKGAPKSIGSNFDCSSNQLNSLKGAPQSIGGDFICSNNQLTSLKGAPQSIGGTFDINLGEIYEEYYHVIIPEIEELISKGIKIYNPEEYYYPYKEAYYNDKIIELL
jgi:hypothetical protein